MQRWMQAWIVAFVTVTATAGAQAPVYVLEVTAGSEAEAHAIVEAGYTIGHVHGASVEIYTSESEFEQIQAAGYDYRLIGTQPDPPDFQRGAKGLGVYHDYDGVTTELSDYAAAFPGITRLESIGQSVQGRELWVLVISDNPDIEENEPEFRYISTMHGDEPIGTELILYLIDRLLNDYGSDARITDLVNETEIWLMPLMNPDGLELGTRANANGLDLNRSFPTFASNFTGTIYDGEPLGDAGRQPEVAAVMNWTAESSFALSANLHTGALLVNYPFDYTPGIPSGFDAPSPDDPLFEDISLRYSSNNPPMFASPTFSQGISNGSEWFSITGGMQDWHYRYAGSPEVLVELSNTKRPAEFTLPTFWANNEESMLSYMEAVHIGVRGRVVEQGTNAPLWAEVTVAGNAQPVFTDPDVGDYYRLLLPGTYDLTFTVPGYHPQTVTGVVVGSGAATVVDVVLEPISVSISGFWPNLLLVSSVIGVALLVLKFML